jgi:uncharacterized delta-60 repeat protein
MVARRTRSRLAALAATVSVALVVLSLASAAGGDLDPTFGAAGTVVKALGSPAVARSVAVQPDGKIVVAAVGHRGGMLLRYGVDGALDPAFGQGGVAATLGGGTSAGSTLVAVQSDGRIVVGGTAEGDFALRRHRADGSVDASFGDGGTVTTDLGANELLWAVLRQPDGRIVAVGSSHASGGTRFAVARYLRDGRLDPGFGNAGTVVAVEGSARAAALAPDGKLVVLGSRTTAEGLLDGIVVARFTVRGALDRTFAGDGLATVSAARRGAPFPSALAVQRDGKVVVANVEGDDGAIGLVRFRADGTLDRAFARGAGSTGRIYGYRAIAIDQRGRIVLAGHGPDLFEHAVVARLTPAGRLDPRFGHGGVVTTAYGRRADANAIAIGLDGRIVAAGWRGTWISADDTEVVVARYRASTCTVPDVRQRTPANARGTLERRGCLVGRTSLARSARVLAGRIVSQRPAPGARVADHVPVTVVVSRGR